MPATPTLLIPLLISCLHVPLVSSLATPLTTRDIAVSTSPAIASSSLVTSFLTKMYFPLLAPPHPSISIPSLSLLRVHLLPRHHASHPCPRLAQLHHTRARLRQPRPCPMWPRRPCSHVCPRHAQPRRTRLRHAWPRRTRPSSITAAEALLRRRPRTQALRRARSDSPIPPSFIIAMGRPRLRSLSRRCTTRSPFTMTPDTFTQW
jgi:hypothetical protein